MDVITYRCNIPIEGLDHHGWCRPIAGWPCKALFSASESWTPNGQAAITIARVSHQTARDLDRFRPGEHRLRSIARKGMPQSESDAWRRFEVATCVERADAVAAFVQQSVWADLCNRRAADDSAAGRLWVGFKTQ